MASNLNEVTIWSFALHILSALDGHSNILLETLLLKHEVKFLLQSHYGHCCKDARTATPYSQRMTSPRCPLHGFLWKHQRIGLVIASVHCFGYFNVIFC